MTFVRSGTEGASEVNQIVSTGLNWLLALVFEPGVHAVPDASECHGACGEGRQDIEIRGPGAEGAEQTVASQSDGVAAHLDDHLDEGRGDVSHRLRTR